MPVLECKSPKRKMKIARENRPPIKGDLGSYATKRRVKTIGSNKDRGGLDF